MAWPSLNSQDTAEGTTTHLIVILYEWQIENMLDSIKASCKDKALRLITNQSVPTPQAIGIWLRRLGKDNLVIHQGDALKFDLSTLTTPLRVVGNIFSKISVLLTFDGAKGLR
jgi:hypothetical protein